MTRVCFDDTSYPIIIRTITHIQAMSEAKSAQQTHEAQLQTCQEKVASLTTQNNILQNCLNDLATKDTGHS